MEIYYPYSSTSCYLMSDSPVVYIFADERRRFVKILKGVENQSDKHVLNTALREGQEVLYNLMLAYVIPFDKQIDMGFPMYLHGQTGLAVVYRQPFKWEKVRGLAGKCMNGYVERLCVRCGKSFYSTPSGEYYSREECVFHWGKIELTKDYHPYNACCGKFPTSPGCTTCKAHVWTGFRPGLNGPLTGFVHTKHPEGKLRQIFGLDTEHVYTTAGLEVARISMVRLDGTIQYEALVCPQHEVLDYNTRFTGITEKDYQKREAKTLQLVQQELLQFIKADTILVGHGLENDLRVLKIAHHLVVDTTVSYPHYLGLPYRLRLKFLTQEILGETIQAGTSHDSAEDARAPVRLMLHKISKDYDIVLQHKPVVRNSTKEG